MIHMLPFDGFAGIVFIHIVEVGPSEHAKEEIEMDHWNGDVRSGRKIFAFAFFAYIQQG
jgi:hypothetical protein